MGEARIKAGIWVSAALRLGMKDNKPGVVVRKGDPDAGGVLVKLYGRSGCVVLSQFRDIEGDLAWMRSTGRDPVPEQAADDYIARQTRFDPDLWVLEFDAADYLPPFEGKIV
ncbi:DUF1491 family protein [Acidocella aminolytica]|jgi:hypothetical protein|nr:DUF1491 family protein [Acidocella aminolytica]GBQ37363.1 hypothetical protein AA11237_1504 [Acidocella aminolytica 101 = DSM 11237]